MSLERQLGSAALAAIVTSASRMCLVAVLARLLTPSSFGQLIYAQWIVEISILVCSMGAPSAVSRYAAEFNRDSALVGGFLQQWRLWASGASLAAAVAAIGISWVSGMALGPAGYACLFFWTATQGLWAMQTAALTGCQRFHAITLANILFATVVASGLLLLPVADAGPALLFGLMSVAAGVAACIGSVATIRRAADSPAPFHESQWRSVRIYAANMWLTALLASLVWSRGEYPLVRAVLGDDGLALYAAAMTLFAGGVQFVMLSTAGVAPYLTDLWGRGRYESAIAVVRQVINLQLLACGVAALALTFLSGDLLEIVFGPSYRHRVDVLPILSLGLVGLAASAPNHLLELVTDARFNRNLVGAGVGLLFTVALVLVPTVGLQGAAMARTTTMMLLAIVTAVVAIRRFGSGLVSMRNFAVVTAVVMASIVLVTWRTDFDLVQRILLLAATVLTLALSLRGDDGTLIVLNTARGVGVFRTPQAERG